MLPWGVKSPDNLSLGICKALRQLMIINDKCSLLLIYNESHKTIIYSFSLILWVRSLDRLEWEQLVSARDVWGLIRKTWQLGVTQRLRAGIIVSYLHSLMLMLAVGWDHNWTVGQNFNLTHLHVGWFGLPHSMAAELYEWAIREDIGEARDIFTK